MATSSPPEAATARPVEAPRDLAFRDAVPRWPDVSALDTAGRKRPAPPQRTAAPMLMKGNEAVVHGAILAGCRLYFGYPITPASEIAHTAAELFPQVGGVFLQAESEIAAIQMVYGAASAGTRCMTASSSPGISLKQEGLSYAAGSELPLVVVDIMRGGPGLGNIAPEQGDYFQMVKGGGHGCYHLIVLAPSSVQEMCDLTMDCFELADRYRNPVALLADGLVGQMKEPVFLPQAVRELPRKDWAVEGTRETRANLICSIHLDPKDLEDHVRHLHGKYKEIERHEQRWEEIAVADADLVLVGYGVVSRILQGVVDEARREGLRVGLVRPITLWPFPSEALRAACARARAALVVELSTGQMVEDVRLAVSDLVPVHFYGRAGGVLPTVQEILPEVRAVLSSAATEVRR
jgi:pyruvate/2-oxoacid:ferredoxin oxidoreductase alpha subunit